MVLSVIVPDNRPGMLRMLEKEIENCAVDAEILIMDWFTGMSKAHGDFVCLLEYDSAISPGSIAKQLEPFLNNPRFRKLAMVSPFIEFDDSEPMSLSSFGVATQPQYAQLARTGSVGGAIVRRTSLGKYIHLLNKNIIDLSYEVSIGFWENGLRIITDPGALYYTPQNAKRHVPIEASEDLSKLWLRECIS